MSNLNRVSSASLVPEVGRLVPPSPTSLILA